MKVVRTYATSANLGPGFDTLGVCLDLYNEYLFEEQEEYELINFDEKFKTNNLIIQSYEKVFEYVNELPRKIKLTESVINIPPARGLGSSASCIIAGILIANEILGNRLSIDEIFQLASSIEGHPDNVAAGIYGGLTCSFEEEQYYTVKYDINDSFNFYVCIPPFELKTIDARIVLPKMISMKEAVSNISHTASLLKAFETGNFDLLKISQKDYLHEPYRYPLIKGVDGLKENLSEDTISMISGAGPTILLISKNELNISYLDWKIIPVKVNYQGAYIYEK